MGTENIRKDLALPVLALVALHCVLLNHLHTVNADIPHGSACSSTNSSSICQQPFMCKPEFSTCLCPDKQYYDSKTQHCESENNLKHEGIKCQGETDSVICHVSQDDSFSVTYTVSVNSSSQIVTFTQGQTEIQNLSPGTHYVATITSKFQSFPQFYSKNRTTLVDVWTKPDKPGNVSSVRKIKGPDNTSELYWYDITFEASRGNVRNYHFVIDNTTDFDTIKTTISNVPLKPGTTYVFRITAYNGISTPSDVRRDIFKTSAEKPGKVKDVTIRQAPCSTDVSWGAPEHPNGQISYYNLSVVAVYGNSICVWRCIVFNASTIDVATIGDKVNCSTADLNIDEKRASIRLLGLNPNTTYNVSVAAINEVGTGVIESKKIITVIAAANVSNILLSSVRYPTSDDSSTGKIKLKISWAPSKSEGDISYNVDIKRAKSRNSNQFEIISSSKGVTDTHIELDDVSAHWNYTAHVQAVSCKGVSGIVPSNPHTTTENNPGQVQNLTVKQHDKEAQIVTIMFDCLNERVHNGIIKKYVINVILLDENGDEVDDGKSHEFPPNSCGEPVNLKVLEVGKQYKFSVKAENQNYSGNYSESQFLKAEARKPLLKEKYPHAIAPKMEEANIKVQVCVSCLRDSSQGNVEHSGLIVCVKGDHNNCGSLDSNYSKFITWRQAEILGYTKPYRTTPDDWKKNLQSHSDNYTFEVGVDTNCDTYPVDHYCNGPLPGGKDIIISVLVCTKAGCDYIQAADIFFIKRPETPMVTVLIILVVLVLISAVAVFVSCRLAPNRWAWLLKRNIFDEPGLPESRPVKMRDFQEHVTKLHKDSNLLMQSEFEDIKTICMTFKSYCNEAQREANRVKNRYVDILPYDHSRVKLNVLPEDEETNDFINANYIPGLNSVREYIATQGPMHCTISDFWRMIWEQKCPIIVMVSDLQENGRLKVDQYWPENLHEPVTFENVAVELTNFSQLNRYIIRSLKISKGKETRKVTQFFLPGWCDFSANVSFDDVLELVQLMRQEITPDTSGPITVHCSAGVGRTGTFIALDYFMQYVDKHSLDDEVDIYEYVLKMRRNRPRMVQAESQYIFIYDAVQEIIKKKIQKETERLYDAVYSDSISSSSERVPDDNTYVEIMLDDQQCAYANKAFEPDNVNTNADSGQENLTAKSNNEKLSM